MTLLAIVAIHTAANEPPKVRQVMNKIHRNVGPHGPGGHVRALPRPAVLRGRVPLHAGLPLLRHAPDHAAVAAQLVLRTRMKK